MLGEWAAKQMGLESVDDYVRAVVRADLGAGGEDDVVRKVIQDLAGAGIQVARAKSGPRWTNASPWPANR